MTTPMCSQNDTDSSFKISKMKTCFPHVLWWETLIRISGCLSETSQCCLQHSPRAGPANACTFVAPIFEPQRARSRRAPSLSCPFVFLHPLLFQVLLVPANWAVALGVPLALCWSCGSPLPEVEEEARLVVIRRENLAAGLAVYRF